LYRGGKKAVALQAKGYNCIDEIPDAEKLSHIAARQREAVKADTMVVETKALTRELEKNLAWPMAFLDFETIQPAIPCWNGCRSFGKIAVQFSCHVMTEDGSLEHQEFLAQGAQDPRRELAQALISVCRPAKIIWTYNMSFEKGCIVDIAKAFPDLADDLDDLVKRLRDLLPIIQNQVYHPNFFGSFSLKKVLPALVPALSYEDLDIADGQAACMALENLLLGSSGNDEDLESTRNHLLEYCKLDTLAMVRLWEMLREQVNL
jgi:predicted RecB family nuclease